MKFRKKPIVVEAERFTRENMDSVTRFIHSNYTIEWQCSGDVILKILTPEGEMAASLGDWIIKGVSGAFYPCKPNVFAATYEQAEPDAR